MMRTMFLLLLVPLLIQAQGSKPDLSFLKNYTPKEKIQKIIDTSDYINNKDPRKALEFINYGFELLSKNPNIVQQRDLYYVQSWAYMELADYDKAKELAEKSLDINTNQKDYSFISNYYMLIASIASYQSNYSEAIGYMFDALAIIEKDPAKHDLGAIYGNIGNIYLSLDLDEEALEYFNKALDCFKKANDKPNIAILHDNTGLILSKQNKFEEALKHFWAANKLYLEVNNIINYYWNFAYLGDSYLNLGDLRNAHKYLSLAYKGSKKYNHSLGIIEASVNLGKLYFKEKNYQGALRVLKEVEPSVIENRNYDYLTTIYQLISDIYKEKRNFEKAYFYQTMYKQYSDSVYSADVQKKIKEAELKYNIDKKENELIILKKNKRLNELEIKRANVTRNYLIAIILSAIIFFSILIFIKTRSIKKLEEKQNIINTQNEMLEDVNKDLVDSKLQLQNLNRNLEEKVIEEVSKRESQQILLMQKSKLESLGIFSAGVAHEINQPLTSISFSIENMLYKKQTDVLTDEYLKDKFNNIIADIKRITTIINHIRVFAREQSNFKLEKFDINEAVTNSLLIVNAQLRNKNICIDISLNESPLIVLGNKFKLEQALLNLILNSRYAVEKKEEQTDSFEFQKRISIKTSQINLECCLSVEDNGIGIPEDKIPKVFEPFFTTKEPEDGTGLGLSIAYGIVKEHYGNISVESEENKFTRFTIKIPSINQGQE